MARAPQLNQWFPARLRSAVVNLRHCLSRSAAPAHPLGMITPQEQAFFADSAACVAGVEGMVVDLGCWMGATSLALADGLCRAGGRGQSVFAFDRFIWEAWMANHGGRTDTGYRPGDCFLAEARRRVRRHAATIRLIQADLTTYRWDGRPIKLLLVDALKNWTLARSVAGSFFPALRPGAVLLEQDFKHYYTSWIHLLHYRLRHHFEALASVPGSGTVAFVATRPVPPDEAESATRFREVTADEADRAFAFSLGLAGGDRVESVAAAHVMHYLHRNELSHARRVWQDYDRRGWAAEGEMATVTGLLEACSAGRRPAGNWFLEP